MCPQSGELQRPHKEHIATRPRPVAAYRTFSTPEGDSKLPKPFDEVAAHAEHCREDLFAMFAMHQKDKLARTRTKIGSQPASLEIES